MNIKETFNPETVQQALEILHRLKDEKVGIVAGGTDFMVKLREHKLTISYLMDITRIAELRGVREDGDSLVIGPLLTHAEAVSHPLLSSYAPVIPEGCAKVGSPQIKYRATIGGNVCTGSPAGDSLPPLAILDARFTLTSLSGERVVDFKDFFLGPQKTDIRPGELLTGIRIAKMQPGERSSFEWLGQRKALTVTKVSVASRCLLKDGSITQVKIALGSVAPTVIRANNAEKALTGRALTKEVIDEAADAIRKDASPIDDVRSTGVYRQYVTGILLKRFLRKLL